VTRYITHIPSDCADWPDDLPRYAPGAHFMLDNYDGTPSTTDLATLVDPFAPGVQHKPGQALRGDVQDEARRP
jgi:hypothetical protein